MSHHDRDMTLVTQILWGRTTHVSSKPTRFFCLFLRALKCWFHFFCDASSSCALSGEFLFPFPFRLWHTQRGKWATPVWPDGSWFTMGAEEKKNRIYSRCSSIVVDGEAPSPPAVNNVHANG